MTTPAPRWDLSNVFPGLESPQYKEAVTKTQNLITAQEENFKKVISTMDSETPLSELAPVLEASITSFNELDDLVGTLWAYLHSFISTDSHDSLAKRLQSEFELNLVRLQKLSVGFSVWIGKLADKIPASDRCQPDHRRPCFYAQRNRRTKQVPDGYRVGRVGRRIKPQRLERLE